MRITIEGIFREQDLICDAAASNTGNRRNALRLLALAAGGLAAYGFIMGIHHSVAQALAAAVKLPLLFLGACAITMPAFHFIGLHLGSRLFPGQTIVVCANGMAITGVLAASFAPISLFFLLSGSGYSFLILAHVAIIGFCSSAGASTMNRNLRRLRERSGEQPSPGADWCFPAWVALYAIVGTQLAYLMRPFVGSGETFILLNTDPGNFYEAVFKTLVGMLTAD